MDDEPQRWKVQGVHSGDGGIPAWSVDCDSTQAAVDYLSHSLHESDAAVFLVVRCSDSDMANAARVAALDPTRKEDTPK
ncbi:hypothetical protein C1I95_24620 [Micromonospora craterilacus]|uniref:Uncharacterized protein n=2 Tax=Micromonospora craterilacus TaxID=1655439 RepID=A0A2W2E6Z5_9ACTN|nr:hypothetical protein C1I95_24620 [Micromonospora craterilacus]